MDAMGTADAVDQDRLLVALDVIRELGAPMPAETNGATEKPTDKATDAQLALIAKMVSEKHVDGPALPITKADAHTIIDSLKAGTYDATKWSVPF